MQEILRKTKNFIYSSQVMSSAEEVKSKLTGNVEPHIGVSRDTPSSNVFIVGDNTDDNSIPSQLVSDNPLAIQKLDTLEHLDKLLAVKKNILKLEDSLSELVHRFLGELRERNIPVSDIINYLTSIQWSKNKEVYNLVHEKMDEMEDVRHLINLLSTVWNFLDYHLLEYIIIKFGSESLKESMRQYVSDFENFQQNTILYDFAQCWPGRQKKPPEYAEVIAELCLDPKTCTLNMMDELRKDIQRKFFPSLSEYISTLLHDKHRMGSFAITWILPPQLADQLIKDANQPENHSFFKENDIISFSVRNQLLYKDKRLLVQAPSLKTLLNELAPVRHKWRKICIQLNISNKKIHDFENLEDPFTEGLDYWLDGNTDVPITWGSMVEALASPHVEEYVFAESLREKWTISRENEEKTDGGETIASALFVASQNGQVEEVKSLLKRGAHINFQTNDGTSALHIASQNGHIKVVKLLLEKEAKVDLLNNDQCSPLMIACEYKLTNVARVLLDHDADTYLRNKKGQTALEIAKEKNHVDIISLFAELKEKVAYPGIHFSEGAKKEYITSDEKTINLEDVGISITFPKNLLSSTEPPLEVAIQPCFSRFFEMPDGIESVIPAYIIKYNQNITFHKDVILKTRHYANLQTEEDCDNMAFLSASSIPEYRGSSPVYVFKEITDTKGLFGPRQEKPLGEIQLKHFPIIATGIKKPVDSIGGNFSKIYSARLFRTEKSAVFCMCLCQPRYMKQCENVITSKYTGIQVPIDYNCVTLSSNEVAIRASENKEWNITFQKTKILRTEIEIQDCYQDNFEELLELNYPPRIDIGVTLTPVTPNPKPLELLVEGLNEDCIFNLHPGHYVPKHQVFPVTTQDKPCDLKNIMNVLKDLSPKQYFDLGLELGIEKSDYEKFEGSHLNNPRRILADIIDQWLRNNSDHSWDALRVTLEAIGEKTLACNI